ncbi:tetratricopeptide repeat protein [bacterium]|nr:tetratricopeptide repeat protein [bacterium]MBP9809933.1 tetratricopeptide repeat protein [bacterium]
MKLAAPLTGSALRAHALALTLALTFSASAASSKTSAKVSTKTITTDLANTGYWRTFLEQGRKQLASKSLPEAEVSFRQALRSVKREPHSVDDLVLCMQSLADVLHTEDYQEEPWKLYRQSLKQLEREYGKESVKLIPVLLTMGSVTEVEGQYKKAAEFYQRAANVAQSNVGPQSFELANCLHHLGHALSQDGPYRDAEDNYRSSLRIMMAQSALPSSEPLLELLSDYLDLLHKYTGPAKILASQYERELLKDQVQELGKTRAVPQSAWQQELERQKQIQLQSNSNDASLNNGRIVIDNNGAVESFSTVAQLLSSLPSSSSSSSSSDADLSSANKGDQIEYYERMVAIDVKSLGPKHPSVARDLKGLAAVYVAQHRYSEARPLLERALEIYQSVYAPDDLSVQRLKVLLALITEQAKAAGDTVSGVDHAELAVIPLQAQTFEVAQRLNELAFLDYSQGKLEDSRNHYAWALSSIANATGRRSVFVAACLQDYVLVMLSSGRKSEAEKMQMQARSILAEALSAKLLRAYK